MLKSKTTLRACLIAVIAAAIAGPFSSSVFSAQEPANAPAYRVSIVPSTITTIGYRHKMTTEIGFAGSPLMPTAIGHATVTNKEGRVAVKAHFEHIGPAQKLGTEYLTFVLWAITPEGKANNLGELLLQGDQGKLDVTTPLQTFGLLVTAEPYYAVSGPSNAIVLQNIPVSGTTGTIEQSEAKYESFDHEAYSYRGTNLTRTYQRPKPEAPLEVQEAWNAVQIAVADGAEQYAPDALHRAETSLQGAETMLANHKDKNATVEQARDAVQNAADARNMAVRRAQEEWDAQQRAAAAQHEAQAQENAKQAGDKAKESELRAQQEQQQAAQAQAARDDAQRRAESERRAAAEAEQAAQQAQAQKEEAQRRADQEQQSAAQAEQSAQHSQQAAMQAANEREQLRAQLLQQFNRILPTTDTPRGLKVDIADVLFSSGKYDLQQNARESLAKFAGIVLAHPGLEISVEGYTDSVGDDAYNLALSENRANTVKAYLIQQGLNPDAISARGFGKANPVASNDTPESRQQNRRVEIIISGDIIGTPISANH